MVSLELDVKHSRSAAAILFVALIAIALCAAETTIDRPTNRAGATAFVPRLGKRQPERFATGADGLGRLICANNQNECARLALVGALVRNLVQVNPSSALAGGQPSIQDEMTLARQQSALAEAQQIPLEDLELDLFDVLAAAQQKQRNPQTQIRRQTRASESDLGVARQVDGGEFDNGPRQTTNFNSKRVAFTPRIGR